MTASLRMVDLLNETGVAVRRLAMTGFMENKLQQAQAIKQGQIFGPLDPDKKVPHTTTQGSKETVLATATHGFMRLMLIGTHDRCGRSRN